MKIEGIKKGESISVNQFSNLVTSTVDSSNFIEDLNHVLYFDF